MHAGPPGQWGVLEAPRAPGPGQALAALVWAVFGGAGRRQQAGVRSRVVTSKYLVTHYRSVAQSLGVYLKSL